MTLANLTDRKAVLSAIREFDKVGRAQFLGKYGYGEARKYFLSHGGRLYDSKAIVGAAHGYQHPDLGPLDSSDFSGGEATVEKRLNQLGFKVIRTGIRQAPSYWALMANPDRYRIREAVGGLREDLWTVGASEVSYGDRVLIWQSLDKQGRRGIVALGEVVGERAILRDEDNPYWVDAEDGRLELPRVRIRYSLSPRLPLWLGASVADQLMESLSVSRARGGTVFRVTSDQWSGLMELIGGWPGVSEEAEDLQELSREWVAGRPSAGQGRGLSQAANSAVEQHAMSLATKYFQSRGMKVVDVSKRASYDLLCSDAEAEFHVEVKGTTTSGDSLLLTSNEVQLSESADCALVLVADIHLEKRQSQVPDASGGRIYLIQPWKAGEHSLKPLTYECKLDWAVANLVSV